MLSDAFINFEKGLMIHAKFRVNDPAVCNDLVQDTFIKTWNYLAKEGKIDLMKPFLYHILNCLIIDEYRRHKNFSLDALMSDGFDVHEDNIDRLFNKFDALKVVKLMNALPTPYGQILQMRYLEEMSLQEISQRTGLTKETVSVQVHRGVLKLRSIYLFKQSHTLAGV